mgnify:CR=1 FL=1
MDLFKPRGASQPRRPTTDQQQNGQIVNTPRYSRFGGLTNPAKALQQVVLTTLLLLLLLLLLLHQQHLITSLLNPFTTHLDLS